MNVPVTSVLDFERSWSVDRDPRNGDHDAVITENSVRMSTSILMPR